MLHQDPLWACNEDRAFVKTLRKRRKDSAVSFDRIYSISRVTNIDDCPKCGSLLDFTGKSTRSEKEMTGSLIAANLIAAVSRGR